MEKVTIKDVATYAGVSVATVSHTINNNRPVSNEVREKVYQAIEALKYIPDCYARNLRTGKKYTVAFVVPDISNKYFATLIEEVESYISAQKYNLIIANTKENKEREKTYLESLSSGMVDGILVASTMGSDQDFSQVMLPPFMPIVFVDRTIENLHYDMLHISTYQSVYRSVEALIRKGHTKIGFIGGLQRLSSAKERIDAYRNAMNDNGLTDLDGLIQYSDNMSSKAIPSLSELLKAGCTAIIITNGLMATETLIYLREKGLRIGEDIQLVCFNDFDSPLLSTAAIDIIEQPVKELGRLAGEQIIQRILEPNAPIKNIILNSIYRSQ